jgi:hypothetical protein
MKVARLFAVALLAIFALSALVASTASAIPKFKLPITSRGFSATSGTSILTANAATPIVVTCTSDTSTGTILNDDEIDARVHFLGCSVKKGAEGPCTIKSVGGGEGLVLTELLVGQLGLLHQPNGAAGILFKPKTGNIFTKFAATSAPCNTVENAVEGSVAGEFSPTGKPQTTGKITLAVTNKKNITLILTLAGIVKPELESFGAITSTEETSDAVTFEESVEIT